MAKNESTAINDLIQLVSGRIVDHGSPAAADNLFVTAPPPPAAFVPVAAYFDPSAISSPAARMAPSGPPPAPLPRRRAPSATPTSLPMQPIFHDDDDDDDETQFDAQFAHSPNQTLPAHAYPVPSIASPLPAYPNPILPHYAYPTPAPLPPAPHVPGYDATERVERYEPVPQQSWPVVQPSYPVVSRASFNCPDTVRVNPLPAPPHDAPPMRGELWAAVKRLALPFAGVAILVGVIVGFAIHKSRGSSAPEPQPVVMAVSTPAPVAVVATIEPIEAIAPVPVVASAVAEGSPTVSATGDTIGWKPTAVQPTFAATPTVEPIVETAAVEPASEIEMEPAAVVKQSPRSRRKAARVAPKAKRVAVVAPAPKVVAPKASSKRVATRAADDDEIAAAIAAPVKGAKTSVKGTGPGTVTITSSPAALIYIDGRSTNQMTPKTLTLPAGAHKITLLEIRSRKAKTQDIDVAAGGSLSVAKKF
jgi:hypothetical protein